MSLQAENEHAMGEGVPPLFPASGPREALMIVPDVRGQL